MSCATGPYARIELVRLACQMFVGIVSTEIPTIIDPVVLG
jgi:hypothetical protein